jgi:hypothetical protein
MNFRRISLIIAGAIIVPMAGYINGSHARERIPFSIGVQIGIPLPPDVVFTAPPSLVVIPGTNVYAAPDVEADLVFYHGYWWRHFRERWYRSLSYRGPWEFSASDRVPRAIYGLPLDFRHMYRDHHRLHQEEVERNWQKWEREHHWDRDDQRFRHDRRDWSEHRDRDDRRDWDTHRDRDDGS